VCLYEGSELKLFPDRHIWFSHELKDHRREWNCHFCSREPFTSKDKYRDDLANRHPNVYIEDQLSALFEMSQRAIVKVSASECPFCEDWEQRLRAINPHIPSSETLVVTPSQFQHHVGGHMEQLALFAIPRGHTEDGDVDSNVSHRSKDSDSKKAAPRLASEQSSLPGSSVNSKVGEDLRFCEEILIEMMNAGAIAVPFMDPHRREGRVLNLPTISQKLQSGAYANAEDFRVNVGETFASFISTNPTEVVDCVELENMFERLWSQWENRAAEVQADDTPVRRRIRP
jgi:hypothetical protein